MSFWMMKRSDFIQLSVLAGTGALFAPSLFSCETLNITTNFKGKVLIIGSGAAGLYAGYLLKQNNIDFTIIEADGVAGGRTRFNSDFCDFNIDLGAEWLHGGNSIFADFVEEKNVEVYLDKAEGKYWHDGQITEDLPPKINRLLRGVLDRDNADISLLDYCKKELGLKGEELNFAEFVAGEYGASAGKLSAKWAGVEEEEWSAGNKDYKFPLSLGYFIHNHLITQLQDHLVLNSPVTSIDYRTEMIRLETRSGNTFNGDKVICTVPITQLKQNKIKFTPELAPDKVAAFHKIGMEPGMKIFLKFNKHFYGDGLLGADICPAYANSGYGKETDDNILMAFVMGDKAKHLSGLGNQSIDVLLDELEGIYGEVVRLSFEDAFIQDWSKNEWVGGAYSYAPVGQGMGKRKLAAEPLGNKVYFAGEAMNTNGHHQSVHGAMETAKKAVELILR